ncbi:MAG: NAD(P)/FAD-dependent oxidoreductase [Blastocatellia bacterium]
MQSFDVGVIGGGPAGTAVSLALSRRGFSVVVVERSAYDSVRIGETLSPEIQVPLSELGVWHEFLTAEHVPCQGIQSAWGSSDLYTHHILFNPYGSGWHINRNRFDAMLAAAAAKAGATVLKSARLISCSRQETGGWRASILAGDQHGETSFRFLVNASGKANSRSRQMGTRRLATDALIGLVSFLSSAGSGEETAPITLIESAPAGWWYSSPLPDARLVVAYLTDAKLWRHSRTETLAQWKRALDTTLHTKARAKRYKIGDHISVFPANSSRLNRVAGQDWIAVGDAALSFDPLAGQGIYNALRSGILAAPAIEDCLRGNSASLHDYEVKCTTAFNHYLDTQRDYYRRENRWGESPFWVCYQSGSSRSRAREVRADKNEDGG